MAITDNVARQALAYHYHQIEEGDSAADLSAWAASILGTNTAGDWVRLNEDGSYSYRAYMGVGFDENSPQVQVGTYLLLSNLPGSMDGPQMSMALATYFPLVYVVLDEDM